MKNIVIDTSPIIAVILGEPERKRLIELARNTCLIASPSLNWEIGNAFSAMFKKNRISLKSALTAVKIYKKIPIQFSDVDLKKALEIAHSSKIYAYDAYVIVCALAHKAPLLTLDGLLKLTAQKYNVKVLEV